MARLPFLIASRLWQLLPIIIFATMVVFFLLQLVPGDPALVLAGEYASRERLEEIRQIYGFDKPLLVQYGTWLWQVLQGDLGKSLLSSAPVTDLIIQRMPNTLLIATYALVIASVIGIPLGVLAATRVGSRVDSFVTSVASLGVALPSFWLAIILVVLFSLDLRWFPATGARPITVEPWLAIKHATLPAIALAVGVIAELARQVRSALIEVLSSQYVRTLRAKGLSPLSVLWKHGLRNVSVTMLTILGLQVNRLFSGAVVIEAVFAIPGAGQLVAYSAINKDFPVVQGLVLVFVVMVILINLIVDVLNALLDPRVAVFMSVDGVLVSATPVAAPRRFNVWRWIRSDLRAVLSLAFLLILVFVSVFAWKIAPYGPNEQNMTELLLEPSWSHWLGTDDLGRDVLSRLIWGAPNSLYAAFLAVAVGIVLGVPLGLLIGFLGGWFDEISSRFIDALLSFPPIVLAIAVTGVLGIGLTNAMLAVGIVFAPVLARIVRAQTLVVKSALYVDAARGFGASTLHIILRHIVPNAIQPVIVQVTLMLAIALLAEASLSFLSLGVQPPQASWGGMLARAYNYIELAPAQMYAPGFAILLTALAFNALGEFMRVALDPTMKRR